eukprot:g44715.t1
MAPKRGCHLKTLEKNHQHCLRQILCFIWKVKHINLSDLEAATNTVIKAMIVQNQLHWAGHVLIMPKFQLPKQIIFTQIKEGTQTRGGHRKCFKDVLKAALKKCKIDTNALETLVQKKLTQEKLLYKGLNSSRTPIGKWKYGKGTGGTNANDLKAKDHFHLPETSAKCEMGDGSQIGLTKDPAGSDLELP